MNKWTFQLLQINSLDVLPICNLQALWKPPDWHLCPLPEPHQGVWGPLSPVGLRQPPLYCHLQLWCSGERGQRSRHLWHVQWPATRNQAATYSEALRGQGGDSNQGPRVPPGEEGHRRYLNILTMAQICFFVFFKSVVAFSFPRNIVTQLYEKSWL